MTVSEWVTSGEWHDGQIVIFFEDPYMDWMEARIVDKTSNTYFITTFSKEFAVHQNLSLRNAAIKGIIDRFNAYGAVKLAIMGLKLG